MFYIFCKRGIPRASHGFSISSGPKSTAKASLESPESPHCQGAKPRCPVVPAGLADAALATRVGRTVASVTRPSHTATAFGSARLRHERRGMFAY